MVKILKFFLFLIIIAALIFGYASIIEPKLLKVETVTLVSENVPEGFTVAVISDTHLKEDFDLSDLERVVKKTNEQAPDAVLFLGDLFDNFKEHSGDTGGITESLKGLEGTIKLCVYGNHDYGGSAQRVYNRIMTDAGFTILKNENIETEYGINFLGLDDYIFGNDDGNGKVSDGFYNFVFAHAPESVKKINGYDFFIAGHAHGGQVRLPFMKPLWLPYGVGEYWSGMYQNEDNSSIYVTRGVGTSIYSIRFNSVPEITICKFSKKSVEK